MQKRTDKFTKTSNPESIFKISWRDIVVIKKKFPNNELTEKEWEELLSKNGIPFSKRRK